MTFYPPPEDPSAPPPNPQGYPPPPGYSPPANYPPPNPQQGYPQQGYPPPGYPPPGYQAPPGYGQPYAAMPPPPPGNYMYGYDPVPGGRKASMGGRFGALVLDNIILAVPQVVIAVAVGGFATTTTQTNCDGFGTCYDTTHVSIGWSAFALNLGIAVLYYSLLIGLRGQTIGHMAAGIRVVDLDSGNLIGFWRAAGRWFVLSVTALVCTLGYWSPFFDSTRRQGWHDKAVGSVVIPAAGH